MNKEIVIMSKIRGLIASAVLYGIVSGVLYLTEFKMFAVCCYVFSGLFLIIMWLWTSMWIREEQWKKK